METVDDKNPTHTDTNFYVVTQTQGSWVPSPTTGDWHGRVGFVVEELKLTTISYIAFMMNFNIFVVVDDEYYNNIDSKKVSAGEYRCFSKWPLNRDVGWVVVIEETPSQQMPELKYIKVWSTSLCII